MRNNRGFTLIELLVSVVISGLLMLTIGALARMGDSTYQKLSNRIQMYNEITNGLKLAKNRIRRADLCLVESAITQWPSERLLIDNRHLIGVYQSATGADKELVYVDDISNMGNRDVIISVRDSETLTFDVTIDATNSRDIQLDIDVEKNNYPVNVVSKVMRRG